MRNESNLQLFKLNNYTLSIQMVVALFIVGFIFVSTSQESIFTSSILLFAFFVLLIKLKVDSGISFKIILLNNFVSSLISLTLILGILFYTILTGAKFDPGLLFVIFVLWILISLLYFIGTLFAFLYKRFDKLFLLFLGSFIIWFYLVTLGCSAIPEEQLKIITITHSVSTYGSSSNEFDILFSQKITNTHCSVGFPTSFITKLDGVSKGTFIHGNDNCQNNFNSGMDEICNGKLVLYIPENESKILQICNNLHYTRMELGGIWPVTLGGSKEEIVCSDPFSLPS